MNSDSGATLVEYGLIVMLIVLVAIGLVGLIGDQVADWFQSVVDGF